ncbi:MAG: hypothetical protein AAF696_38920 [Bacteroidota bacterium]
MKIREIIISLSLLLLSSLACQEKNPWEEVEKQVLVPDSKIQTAYDSIPLRHVSGILIHDQSVFVSDHTNMRVLELDRALSLKRVLARSGKGPCEVLFPASLIMRDQALFLFDHGNKRFLRMDLDKMDCNSFPFKGKISTDYDFLGKSLVLSAMSQETPLFIFDLESLEEKGFGHMKEAPIKSKNVFYNNRHVAVNSQGTIFALPEGIPLIEVYDAKGKLQQELDISAIPPIASRFQFAKTDAASPTHNENTIYVLYGVAIERKDKLYLLAPDNFGPEDGDVKNNTILVFDISTSTPVWEKWYELDSQSPEASHWYIAFDIMDGELLAYEGVEGEFHYFSLGQ